MAPNNAALRARFQKFARQSWRPETTPADLVGAASKYSGLPLLLEGEAWPKCGACSKELQLFLQLDVATLPQAAQERIGLSGGTIQLFYCTASDCDRDGVAFSKVQLVRLLSADAPSAPASSVPASMEKYFPAKTITEWAAFDDFPSPEEDVLPEMSENDYDAYYVSEPYLNADGEKLCGWPNWIQDKDYPDCPKCGRQMELVYQLDSYTEAQWMWGDAGMGHLTQCPEHRDVLTFSWAST